MRVALLLASGALRSVGDTVDVTQRATSRARCPGVAGEVEKREPVAQVARMAHRSRRRTPRRRRCPAGFARAPRRAASLRPSRDDAARTALALALPTAKPAHCSTCLHRPARRCRRHRGASAPKSFSMRLRPRRRSAAAAPAVRSSRRWSTGGRPASIASWSRAIASVAHRDLLAVQGAAAARRRAHLDVVADQMLALARRIAAVADRHAESRQHERAHERAHRLEIAGSSASGASNSTASSSASSANGAARYAVEQQVRQQPVGLRGRPAQRRRGPRGSSAPARPRAPRDRRTRRAASRPAASLWPSTVIAAFSDV